LAATELLNEVARAVGWEKLSLRSDIRLFLDKAAVLLPLLDASTSQKEKPKAPRQAEFHTALSFLHLENPAAAAEVDHHMADYKLLRNMLAVLIIDLVARACSIREQLPLFLLEIATLGLCFIAFVRMFAWAQLLAYQYVCLILDGYEKKNKASQIPMDGME